MHLRVSLGEFWNCLMANPWILDIWWHEIWCFSTSILGCVFLEIFHPSSTIHRNGMNMIQLSPQIQAFFACFCADVSCHAGLHLGRASCHVEGMSRTGGIPKMLDGSAQMVPKNRNAKQRLAFQWAVTVFEPIRCIFSVPRCYYLDFCSSYMKILCLSSVGAGTKQWKQDLRWKWLLNFFQSMRVTRHISEKPDHQTLHLQ